MSKIILILDLDGVLITTPPWKADEIAFDGYSKFNRNCVDNLNILLLQADFEIWLSSTRRTMKSLQEFRLIFEYRNIKGLINGFLPEYETRMNRKDEILKFIEKDEISKFLIIDDDKSLNGLNTFYKEKLVLTVLQEGFNDEKLQLAIEIVKKTFTKI